MERTRTETTTSSFLRNRSILIGVTAILALLMVWSLRSNVSTSSVPVKKPKATAASFGGRPPDSASISWCSNIRQKTFYDDPNLSYSIEKPIKNWDEKRRRWLNRNPRLAAGARRRILLLTGSQPSQCNNPIGDHLLLRLFKNKVDYCRRHGYDVFYNNALLHPKMGSFWAKIPAVRAAMVAHPETEWIWWVDSDAVFTDMDFVPPLERYKDYNLVVGGSPELVYKHPSSIGLHAGVFYIRNCQWSLDFIEAWAKMGPQTPNYEKWGPILKSTIHDKLSPESDDQTAMVYLLLKEKDKWMNKVLLEQEHCIQGYWEGLAVTLDNVTRNYVGLEKKARRLRRRHAEKVSESYGALWQLYLEATGYRKDAGKRPCIFTGCQPCSGDQSVLYPSDSCWKAMEKALNFADNQVFRNYGFVRRDLLDSSHLSPVPFDFPS
ncbi:Glycosyltransferase 7 [Actinidia chinensis var. chinensis]|uniref:Glycosyltransferase 7 n=1 Tax=Actinidia chinensis var. chinensis TaxID=1590841 RepID=A0A2R6R5D2_ACTCC|nr:Glycosyltransferase 7 [Actinidia chinensis var. chinensis]